MPTATPLTDAIEALITYANSTTGASDTTLSEAVATLIDGYGGGGEGGTLINVPIQGKPLTTAITSLTAYINTITGQSDQTLSEAVATLVAGYNTYTWEYSYANGDFYVIENGNYGNATSATGANRLIVLNSSNRWSFGLYDGIYPLKGGTNAGNLPWSSYTVIVPNIFPVPIPPTATKATITPTPSTMKCQSDLCTITEDGYTRSVDTGWTTGTKVVTFSAGQYTHIAPKTQGTVTELTVIFEK